MTQTEPQGSVEESRAARRPPGGPARPTLVSLAAVTWDFKLVGRTRMLTEAWQRLEQPTVFVQVPSYRTALQRCLAPFRTSESVPIVRPWPTQPARRWRRLGPKRVETAMRRRARELRRQLNRLVDWGAAVALVVTPVWTPWLEELPFGRVVYDCIDELGVQVPRADLLPLYQDWERRLIARADAAVVTAEVLGAGLRQRRGDLPQALIRNGVDVERFQTIATTAPRPADLPATERPIIGFVGALYEWIDWALIEACARQLPEADFVFVGPHDGRSEMQRLGGLKNVRLLGPRPYAQVPAYVAGCTVCWVPFKQNAVGAAANPVKIYEYLALGKPVVTTPVADTAVFGALLAVGRSADEIVVALRAALAGEATSSGLTRVKARDARVAFARENSWEARAREYVRFVQKLGAGRE